MKKAELVQAMFTQEEIAAINTENIKLKKENKNMKLVLEQMENTCKDYLNDRDTLREENSTLKANVEFLHQCLDDRENSIELMKESIAQCELENKKLKDEIKKLKER
jgi:chromosome segregation ATPase